MEAHQIENTRYTKIGDDMTWPSCSDEVAHIEWKIRYAPDKVTRGDMLVAASIISAYIDLTRYSSQKKRNAVCKALKKAAEATEENEPAECEHGLAGCLMPGDHMPEECHTVEMMEAQADGN